MVGKNTLTGFLWGVLRIPKVIPENVSLGQGTRIAKDLHLFTCVKIVLVSCLTGVAWWNFWIHPVLSVSYCITLKIIATTYHRKTHLVGTHTNLGNSQRLQTVMLNEHENGTNGMIDWFSSKLYQHRPQTVKTIPVRKSSLKNCSFAIWKSTFGTSSRLLYFEGILVYFENIFLYFESRILYFEGILLYCDSVLRKYTFVLRKYTFVLRKYTFLLWKYIAH